MESVIAVALMIAILEIRELQWNKRFKELEEKFITTANCQIDLFSDFSEKIKSTNEIATDNGNDIRNLRVTTEGLKTEQANLIREYEVRIRQGGLEDGQPIDGIIGL